MFQFFGFGKKNNWKDKEIIKILEKFVLILFGIEMESFRKQQVINLFLLKHPQLIIFLEFGKMLIHLWEPFSIIPNGRERINQTINSACIYINNPCIAIFFQSESNFISISKKSSILEPKERISWHQCYQWESMRGLLLFWIY